MSWSSKAGNCLSILTGLNFRVLILCAGLMVCGLSVAAQSITVYKSPHKTKKTLANVLASIKKNKFELIGTREFEAKSEVKRKFKGKVYVVEFKISEVDELAACEPTAMLDMPLKVILWEEQGDPYIGYMRTNELKKRFLATECEDVLRTLNRAMIRVTNDAIRIR